MQATDPQNLCPGCMRPRLDPTLPCPCGYAGQPNLPHQLAIGSVLDGKYLIGRALGQGGFGITYMAFDLNLQLRLAIKEYYPGELVTRDGTGRGTVYAHTGQGETAYAQGRERFLREARMLAQFQYLPGIVMVREYFTANHTAYIVMEYVEGGTLKQAIAKAPGGKLSAGPLLRELAPLMESLEIVHATGLLHRDISPDNIMVRPDGRFVLLDFGAARQFSIEGEHSNTVNVKHGYAPPEQYQTRGNQGPWTDVYALCATIYKATTGQTPPQSIDRLTGTALPTPRSLGADLTAAQEAVILEGMALPTGARTQSVKALRQALMAPDEAAGKSAPPKRAATPPQPKPPQPAAERDVPHKPQEPAAPKKDVPPVPPKKPDAPIWPTIITMLLVSGLIILGVIVANQRRALHDIVTASEQPVTAAPTVLPKTEAAPESVVVTAAPEPYVGEYTLNEDGTEATITQDTGYASAVIIPDTIDGAAVTAIGENAFSMRVALRSVTIPDGVTTIGDGAFGYCYLLTDVTIPESVTVIGDFAFACCSLTSVTIPESVTVIGEYAFAECESLTSVTIPESVTVIGEYAFGWCPVLTIHTPANSAAHRYAQENGIDVELI